MAILLNNCQNFFGFVLGEKRSFGEDVCSSWQTSRSNREREHGGGFVHLHCHGSFAGRREPAVCQ